MFYCSAQCRCDDQYWHYKACSKAYDSSDDEEYQDKKKPGLSLCGLKNLGNTCYMNSSIQLVLSIEPLKNYLLSNKFIELFNK